MAVSWFVPNKIMAIEGTHDVMTAFGERVRELRNEKGFTQEKLADLAGIEIRQLGRIERGKTNTTISTAVKIAHGLGVGICELFK